MATFEQLSAEGRAIVDLVLRQRKSYEELAAMLNLPEGRVAELARAALVELAPITARAVEPEWREALADYVLGQQAGTEAAATKGHLRRSEPARAWAGSLLDSLDGLLGDERPAIPGVRERRRGGRRREPAAGAGRSDPPADARAAPDGAQPREPGGPAAEQKRDGGRTTLPGAADAARRRRRLAAVAAGALALVAVGLLLWPVGLLSGGADGGDARQAAASPRRTATSTAAGIALVAERDGGRQLIVQATLPPSRAREAYEVWLYNSRTDARSLGAQVSDARGSYQGVAALPADFRRYRFIDVSREPVDRNRSHSGRSVLRGRVPALRRASPRRGQAAIVGQVVLTPPRPG